jgi:hypothetical protein
MRFKGFKTGGVFYKRLSRTSPNVATHAGPTSICLFAAGCFGRTELIAVYDTGDEVAILDKEGQPVDRFEDYLVFLLSDDERDLLTMFGVDLEAVRKRAVTEE